MVLAAGGDLCLYITCVYIYLWLYTHLWINTLHERYKECFMPFQTVHLLAAAKLIREHQLATITTETPENKNTYLGEYLKIFHPAQCWWTLMGSLGHRVSKTCFFHQQSQKLEYFITTMLMGRTLETKIKWDVFKRGWSKHSLQICLLGPVMEIYYFKSRKGAESRKIQHILLCQWC